MWAITPYYNPARYKSRLPNFRTFRANLGIPLVTVELSFDGTFELVKNDSDILVQIDGGAVLWQKERLLNVAVKSVPKDECHIAWIDGDVVFERRDWVDEAEQMLQNFSVVQLLSDQVDLKPGHLLTDSEIRHISPSGHGVISRFKDGELMQPATGADSGKDRRSFVWGLAWAARREILEEHGLYDAMISGGGTRALVSTMYGQFDKVIEAFKLNSARQQHYLKWARPYHRAVNGHVGYIPGRIYHLWHGDIENRNYAGRYQPLADLNFEPADVVVGPNGAWQWARPRPDLEKFLLNHFIGRAEDG